MTQEQYRKLPRWAQMEFSVLESNLESATRRLSVLTGEKTRISYGYEVLGNVGYVPEEEVRFAFEGYAIEVSLRHDFPDGISVMGVTEALDIYPEAANSIRIKRRTRQ